MAILLIPSILRALTEGLDRLEVSARTVDDAVDALCLRFPEAGARLRQAMSRRYVIVSVAGTDLRDLAGGATPVGAEQEIHLLWAVAGG
jgi:molybdopterin converting factor small subunit